MRACFQRFNFTWLAPSVVALIFLSLSLIFVIWVSTLGSNPHDLLEGIEVPTSIKVEFLLHPDTEGITCIDDIIDLEDGLVILTCEGSLLFKSDSLIHPFLNVTNKGKLGLWYDKLFYISLQSLFIIQPVLPNFNISSIIVDKISLNITEGHQLRKIEITNDGQIYLLVSNLMDQNSLWKMEPPYFNETIEFSQSYLLDFFLDNYDIHWLLFQNHTDHSLLLSNSVNTFILYENFTFSMIDSLFYTKSHIREFKNTLFISGFESLDKKLVIDSFSFDSILGPADYLQFAAGFSEHFYSNSTVFILSVANDETILALSPVKGNSIKQTPLIKIDSVLKFDKKEE